MAIIPGSSQKALDLRILLKFLSPTGEYLCQGSPEGKHSTPSCDKTFPWTVARY